MIVDKVALLVKILLDSNARIDERDDAAIYLGEYDDDRALDALIAIALNPQEEQFVMSACGESIARIWVRRNCFDFESFKKMSPNAQYEIYAYLVGKKPEWIEKFNLTP